jgi:hypothetical protein
LFECDVLQYDTGLQALAVFSDSVISNRLWPDYAMFSLRPVVPLIPFVSITTSFPLQCSENVVLFVPEL